MEIIKSIETNKFLYTGKVYKTEIIFKNEYKIIIEISKEKDYFKVIFNDLDDVEILQINTDYYIGEDLKTVNKMIFDITLYINNLVDSKVENLTKKNIKYLKKFIKKQNYNLYRINKYRQIFMDPQNNIFVMFLISEILNDGGRFNNKPNKNLISLLDEVKNKFFINIRETEKLILKKRLFAI